MPATTPILFPSGEDANPLNRRLPAEVVTRRRREIRKVEEKPPDDVQVDLKTALAVKPESRPKWLGKACKMAEDGKVSTTELYNIITGRKFVVGLHPKILRKLRDIVHEHLVLFSDKQQRHLGSDEWVLNATQERGGADADDKDDAARTEDNSARGQAPAKPAGGGAPGEWQEGEEDPRTTRRQHEAQERARLEALRVEEERQRRKAAEREERERWLAAEAEAEAEASRKRKRQLEAETDSSMLMLERMGQQKQQAPELRLVESKGHRQLRDRSAGEGARQQQQQGGLSRSRSISSGGARAAAKGRRGRGAGSRSRSGSRRRDRGRRDKDRRRRRRSASDSPRDRAAFSEALRKRMAEREAHDTTRIPVVDPGHAQRWK